MLKDIDSAEEKILSALPEMAEAVQSQELKAAFELHETETEEHVTRLERRSKKSTRRRAGDLRRDHRHHRGRPGGDEGVQGYARSGRRYLAAAQAVEHYEIARYGTLKTWAGELGLNESCSFWR